MSSDFSTIYAPFIRSGSLTNNSLQQQPVRTAIFYVNDIHGVLHNAKKIKTAADTFTRIYQPQVDTFKLAAGDTLIGRDNDRNSFLVEFLNSMGLDMSTLGNHELDQGESNLAKAADKAKFRFIAANLKANEKSPLSSKFNNGKIVQSCTVNRNGHDYGFIGATPVDLKNKTSVDAEIGNIQVDDLDHTIQDIQDEVNKLTRQGVNKIILVSHLGKGKDFEVANKVSGIDVIIGGHTHDIIHGNEGLVVKPNGEKVIITQAGQDGEYFGVLNVIFDSNGVIRTVKNDVLETDEWEDDHNTQSLEDNVLGKAKPVGVLTKNCNPNNRMIEENPLISFVLDTIREKSKAQIVLKNSAGMRGKLKAGIITARDIQQLNPFRDALYKVQISEKDLIEALNVGAKSSVTYPYQPGLLQVSGLRYTVTPQGTVKDVFMVNPDNSLTRLNHVSPDPSRKFTVAYDDYLMGGREGFTMLKKRDSIIEVLPWFNEDAVDDYLTKLNFTPFEIKSDGRINREKTQSNMFAQFNSGIHNSMQTVSSRN